MIARRDFSAPAGPLRVRLRTTADGRRWLRRNPKLPVWVFIRTRTGRSRRGDLRVEARLSRTVVIFSGIQPTGRKHLGNYIGAILQYVEGQDRGDPAIYCIVDLHGTTVAYDPAELRERALRHGGDAGRRRARPRALHPLPPGRRAGAHRAVWLLSSVTSVGAAQPHAPVPRQVGRRSASACRRACCSTRS